MHGGAGRKREWQPMESSGSADDDGSDRSTQAHGYSHSGGGGRTVHGEAIEKEMKKLRLAHDYDGA